MAAHKVATFERGRADDGGPGYAAACKECDAITFGGFPTRHSARRALAGHEETNAPGARCNGPEGNDTTPTARQEYDVMTSIPPTTNTVQQERTPGQDRRPSLDAVDIPRWAASAGAWSDDDRTTPFRVISQEFEPGVVLSACQNLHKDGTVTLDDVQIEIDRVTLRTPADVIQFAVAFSAAIALKTEVSS